MLELESVLRITQYWLEKNGSVFIQQISPIDLRIHLAGRNVRCGQFIQNMNEDVLQRAENSISEYLPNAPDIEDITETQWTILLQKLCTAADDFFQELSSNMNLLVSCKDVSRKNRIITRWITAISSCYLENPDYLLNAMAGMYQLYLLETGGSFDPSKTLRQQTRYWLRTCCGASGKTWYAFWLDKSGSDAPTSKVYAIIHDWKNQWAQWNCCEPTECEEAPLPGGDLFRILAQDIYTFAKQPYLGYRQF